MRRRYKRDFNAMANTIARARGFEEQEIVNLTLPNRVSFQLLLSGEAEALDVGRLIDHMNVSLVRCWGTPMQPIAQAALDALRRCYERYGRLGKWGLDGPARSEVEQGVELYEELVRMSTLGQMQDAAMRVERIKVTT